MYTNEKLQELAKKHPVEGEDVALVPTEKEWTLWGKQLTAEEVFELLGPPSGVGLPNGLLGQGVAWEEPELKAGDSVMENWVTRRGLRVVRIVRLGSAPDGAYYELKLQMLGGREVEQWTWVEEEKQMYWLVVVWNQ
ncbi:MAG: hypothetical protein DWQ07_14055 [Chloroflexi bacterium]|nr:MAG: hypothetical protein DWQ07_14055 [Chloroflexota bacterium]